jgi:hypothetical protein
MEELLERYCLGSEEVRSIKLSGVEGAAVGTMLMRLLVGDGDRKRMARRKLLSPISKVIGCAIGRDLLVVNVGESGRDNQEAVEEYMEHLNDSAADKQKLRKEGKGSMGEGGQELPTKHKSSEE